jgi:hypothetical protein
MKKGLLIISIFIFNSAFSQVIEMSDLGEIVYGEVITKQYVAHKNNSYHPERWCDEKIMKTLTYCYQDKIVVYSFFPNRKRRGNTIVRSVSYSTPFSTNYAAESELKSRINKSRLEYKVSPSFLDNGSVAFEIMDMDVAVFHYTNKFMGQIFVVEEWSYTK